MTHLTLTSSALAAIRGDCEAVFPHEACGLLLGRESVDRDGDADAGRHVTAIVSGRNLLAASDRFLLDPVDFLRADALGRELGLDLVGTFHSHPERPAIPSVADEAAAQRGWSHVIVSVMGGRCVEVRSWAPLAEAGAARLVEERLRVEEDPAMSRRSA